MRWGAAASPHISSGGARSPPYPIHVVRGGMRSAAPLSADRGGDGHRGMRGAPLSADRGMRGAAPPRCSGMRAAQVCTPFFSTQETAPRMLMEQGRARNFRIGYCSIILFFAGAGRRYFLGGGGEVGKGNRGKRGKGKKVPASPFSLSRPFSLSFSFSLSFPVGGGLV